MRIIVWLFLCAARLNASITTGSETDSRRGADYYCSVRIPFDVRGKDGRGRVVEFQTCTTQDGELNAALAATDVCQREAGFSAPRAWTECGGLLWREHHLQFHALGWSPQCPWYGPEDLWRFHNLAMPIQVLEFGAHGPDRRGCFVAERYLLGHAASTVTRVASGDGVPVNDGKLYDVIHAFIEEIDENFLRVLGSQLRERGLLILQCSHAPGQEKWRAISEILETTFPVVVVNGGGEDEMFLQVQKRHMSSGSIVSTVGKNTLTLHVVSISESPTWDSRWRVYFDFLATCLPRAYRTNSDASIQNLDAHLTVERDLRKVCGCSVVLQRWA